jgi:hypothetical protein
LCILGLSQPSIVRADFELPLGSIGNCPFIHNDKYDIAPLLETLKAQIATEIESRTSCKKELQSLVSGLSPLQDFYKTLDPATKQKITKSVYANALSSLNSKKVNLELNGGSTSLEYGILLNQMSSIESSNLLNTIELQSIQEGGQEDVEAYYRNQLLAHTSNILNTLGTTTRNRPECVGKTAGWDDILAAVLSGVSAGAGLGLNPTAQLIGAAAGIGAQLVTTLQDTKIRSAYNDLVRLKNYRTLACTYYAIKKASCEYQRAYKLAQDPNKLIDYMRNRYSSDIKGEYERFFVNQGRVAEVGNIFSIVAQMGSPLTLDPKLIYSYIEAKAVDFDNLGTPPMATDRDEVIKGWLIKAKAFGLSFQEMNPMTGQIYSLKEQLDVASTDIKNKIAVIESAEKIMKENASFLDLRRRLSSVSPNITSNVNEMIKYFKELRESNLILAQDKPAIKAAEILLVKLEGFLTVVPKDFAKDSDLVYEAEILSTGGDVFKELAKGAVAQLNKQSVLALASKGTDRLMWAFKTIRNGYLNRDQLESLPQEERFGDYQKNHDVLSDVIENYNSFYGSGTTFKNENLAQAVTSFEKAFKKEMYKSLKMAMDENFGWEGLKGKTAAHLCALYSSTLMNLSKKVVFDNKSDKLIDLCRNRYKELETNRLVSNENFKINYQNECTYFDYTRETDIQNLLARLITTRP